MSVAVTFIAIVDGAITTVALPSIGRQFHISAAALDGVVVVYPVCLAVVIPASAWLVDRFGGRRALLLSLAGFIGSSVLCGSAADLGQLIAFRAVQGLSGGLLLPAATSLMFRTFDTAEQVRMARIMIVPQQLAPALAPLLGGLLVDGLSWRWVFYVNVPFGVPAVLFGLLFLADHREHPPGRFDLPGLLLCAGGLGTMMYGVCEGPQLGWTSATVSVCLAAGAALLAAAAVVELRTAEPMLRLRLFTDRLFRDTNLIVLVGLVPILGAMYLGPLFLQQGRGGSALASGSSTFTEAFGVLLTVQVAGAVYARVGPRVIIGCGLLGVAGVLLLFATCDAQTSLWTFRLYMFLLGVAMGGVFMPTTVASVTTVARADSAQASTLNTVVRQTGGALAPAVVTTVLVFGARGAARVRPPIAAYQHAYLVLAVIAAAVALFAFTMPDGPARRAAAVASGRPATAGPPPRAPERPAASPGGLPVDGVPVGAGPVGGVPVDEGVAIGGGGPVGCAAGCSADRRAAPGRRLRSVRPRRPERRR